MKEWKNTNTPNTTVTTGGNKLRGTGRAIIPCVIRDEEGNRRPAPSNDRVGFWTKHFLAHILDAE